MDGASTAWSLISSGYKVFKKVKALRKAVKDAPEKLQSLEDSCIFLEQLLENIHRAESHLPTSINPQLLERLSGRVQRGLDEVEKIVDKVTKGCLDDEGVIKLKISRVKWIWYKEDFEEIERELNGLRDILSTWTQQTALEIVILNRSSFNGQLPTLCGLGPTPQNETICGDIAPIFDDKDGDCSAASSPTVALGCSIPKDRLRCRPRCKCRCHYPSVTRLVPEPLASYVGQLTISRRLLHPTFSPWSLCNVQTCRGNFQRAATIRWIPPFRILHGFLESSNDCRIHLSIAAPRVIPWDLPIVVAVRDGDLHSVRNLFATGRGSIWDYTVSGQPLLVTACHRWQNNPTEQRLEILRLFVEAGAQTLLFEETQTYWSAHDVLVGGFFTDLLGETLGETPDERQSLAAIVRTNTTATTIFRSLLNIDPMDALEDYLNRNRARTTDVTSFIASLENIPRNSESRSSVFQVIGYSPLQYAIEFSPESVKPLLADGEDAAAGPFLVYAIRNSLPELIKPLLDAGADVNMMDWRGRTVLLEACEWCYYNAFLELLRWAEDVIDWDACAPNGQNALELFDSAVSAKAGHAPLFSHSELDEFHAALVAHMNIVEDESAGQLHMPGAFPDAPYA